MAAADNGFNVTFCGLGGQGALTFGQYLAEAAAKNYEEVSLFPNYGAAMRGGDSESTVTASHQPISSPIYRQMDAAVATSPNMFRQIEKRLRPNGVLLVDSSIITETAQREDIRVFYIPAAKIAAEKMGQSLVSNFILMGAYLEATKVLPLEAIEQLMERKLKGTARENMLALNVKALREGAALVVAGVA